MAKFVERESLRHNTFVALVRRHKSSEFCPILNTEMVGPEQPCHHEIQDTDDRSWRNSEPKGE